MPPFPTARRDHVSPLETSSVMAPSASNTSSPSRRGAPTPKTTQEIKSCLRTPSSAAAASPAKRNVAIKEAPLSLRRSSSDNPPLLTKTNTDSPDSLPSNLRKVVSFNKLQVREYEVTLGDHPGVTSGPPVQLSWKLEQEYSMDLDVHEKAPKRQQGELRMPPKYREELLRNSKFSRQEINSATWGAVRVKQQRATSFAMQEMEGWVYAMESAGRKFKRWRNRKKPLEPAAIWLKEHKKQPSKSTRRVPTSPAAAATTESAPLKRSLTVADPLNTLCERPEFQFITEEANAAAPRSCDSIFVQGDDELNTGLTTMKRSFTIANPLNTLAETDVPTWPKDHDLLDGMEKIDPKPDSTSTEPALVDSQQSAPDDTAVGGGKEEEEQEEAAPCIEDEDWPHPVQSQNSVVSSQLDTPKANHGSDSLPQQDETEVATDSISPTEPLPEVAKASQE